MTIFSRLAVGALVLSSAAFLASCASDEVASNGGNRSYQPMSSSKSDNASYNRERAKGVKTNPDRYVMTLKQIKTAALKGDADAQYALGFMYYYGKKVDRDMSLAKKWIGRAAAQGQQRAITAMKLLGDKAPTVAKQTQPTTTTKTQPAKVATFHETKPIAAKTVSTTIASATKNIAAKPATTTTVASNHAVSSIAKTPVKVDSRALRNFEHNLMKKPDDHYTLQLLGSRHLDQVESVIAVNHLANKSAIYHTQYQNKDWYVLVYGDFDTPDAALAAIDRLPPMAQQLKPWVKPFASVKVGIRGNTKHTA